MRNLALIVLVLFVPFWCGCIKFYSQEQYQFKVVDAEQNKPVEGAIVSVAYIFKEPVLNAPKPAEVVTDQSGLAELKVADYKAHLRARAEGYIPLRWLRFRKDSPAQHNFKIQNDSEVIVSIYKEPKPTIEIVVPDGYRGPVALEFLASDKPAQVKAGQRFFSYNTSPKGYVQIQHSPLFDSCKIIARYENGNPVPRPSRSRPEQISFLRVYTRDQKRLYLIGTFKEEDELKRKLWPSADGALMYGGPYDENFFSYFPK